MNPSLSKHWAGLDVVNSLQDFLPREFPNDVLVVVPQLEDGSLGAVVLERLDNVAVDVGGQSIKQLGFRWRFFFGFFTDCFVVDVPPVDIIVVFDVVAATPIVKVEAVVVVIVFTFSLEMEMV